MIPIKVILKSLNIYNFLIIHPILITFAPKCIVCHNHFFFFFSFLANIAFLFELFLGIFLHDNSQDPSFYLFIRNFMDTYIHTYKTSTYICTIGLDVGIAYFSPFQITLAFIVIEKTT